MSVERLGLIGRCNARVAGAPPVRGRRDGGRVAHATRRERGWLRTTLEGLTGEPRGCEVLLSEALDRILRRKDGP